MKNIWLPLAVLLFVGCKAEPLPSWLPELHPVQVKVLQDAAPLPAAVVTLFSSDGVRDSAGLSAGGATGSDGIATIRTQGKYVGVPAGRYKICISRQIVDASPAASTDPGSEVPNSAPVEVVQRQFREARTSPFEIVVPVESDECYTCDIGTAVSERLMPR